LAPVERPTTRRWCRSQPHRTALARGAPHRLQRAVGTLADDGCVTTPTLLAAHGRGGGNAATAGS